jgi:hypothetical protein
MNLSFLSESFVMCISFFENHSFAMKAGILISTRERGSEWVD